MKKNKFLTGIGIFTLGIVALIISSSTRTPQHPDYIQFPTLIAFFFACGWLLSLFWKKIWPYPAIFIFPSVVVLIIAFFINWLGRLHFIGETLMIIPSFLIGFYFGQWTKKMQLLIAASAIVFYTLYIVKINPEFDYYNNAERRHELVKIPDKILPNFVFQKPDGSLISLDEYKGKVVLIDFWFNRCSQCIRKMPDLGKLQNHYKDKKDFVLLAIHRGVSESFFDFLSRIKTLPQNIQFAYDSASTAPNYLGIDGFPHEILIDRKGHIREQFAGYSDDVALVYAKNTIKKIDALLNEKE